MPSSPARPGGTIVALITLLAAVLMAWPDAAPPPAPRTASDASPWPTSASRTASYEREVHAAADARPTPAPDSTSPVRSHLAAARERTVRLRVIDADTSRGVPHAPVWLLDKHRRRVRVRPGVRTLRAPRVDLTALLREVSVRVERANREPFADGQVRIVGGGRAAIRDGTATLWLDRPRDVRVEVPAHRPRVLRALFSDAVVVAAPE